MTTQARPGALAPYSRTPIVPVTLSYLGITLTTGVTPVGVIVLGTVFIAGALYTAYCLATRGQDAPALPITPTEAPQEVGALHLLSAESYLTGVDVIAAF